MANIDFFCACFISYSHSPKERRGLRMVCLTAHVVSFDFLVRSSTLSYRPQFIATECFSCVNCAFLVFIVSFPKLMLPKNLELITM